MNQVGNFHENYDQTALGAHPMGDREYRDYDFPKQPDVRTPRSSQSISAKTRLLAQLRSFPVLFSTAIFMILLSGGVLDSWILTVRVDNQGHFPVLDRKKPVPVLKAAVKTSSNSNSNSVKEVVGTQHKIEQGETLWRIALEYGLSVSTLLNVNQRLSPDEIKVGEVLFVPYRDGFRVPRKSGERAEDIAVRFNTETKMIQSLPVNHDWFVVGGIPENSMVINQEGNLFNYPVSGKILVPFGRGVDSLTGIPFESDGIDIAADTGTLVSAARDGTVVQTGHNAAYGLYVILAHAGGWKSFYGYLSRVDVASGDRLKSGEFLGAVGNSGTATRGSNLHFGLLRNETPVDPLDYLN